MRKIADDDEYKTPATIEDPAALDEIAEALQTIGYGRSSR
jgi:propionyl-CoA synthetase